MGSTSTAAAPPTMRLWAPDIAPDPVTQVSSINTMRRPSTSKGSDAKSDGFIAFLDFFCPGTARNSGLSGGRYELTRLTLFQSR